MTVLSRITECGHPGPVYAKNKCQKCYNRDWYHEDKYGNGFTPRVPTCHPNRKHQALGLCSTCYERERLAAIDKRATCHPSKKNFACGLCSACYEKSPHKRRATCHPALPAHVGDLCKTCYARDYREANPEKHRAALDVAKAKRKAAKVPKPPKVIKVPECGHPERKVHAKNQCRQCYVADRKAINGNAPCHNDRPLYAAGKCQQCYLADFDTTKKKRATCHPDLPHQARGLCAPCYFRDQVSKRATKATCHPERAHCANGLCRQCDSKARLAAMPASTCHPDRLSVNTRGWCSACDQRFRSYGVTPQDFAAAMVAQQGACPLCRNKFKSVGVVDHDHNTNRVRSLLCTPCNTKIGHLEKYRYDLDRVFDYCDNVTLTRTVVYTGNLKRDSLTIASFTSNPHYDRYRKHGIAEVDFLAALEAQGGCCYWCRKLFKGSRGTHVDHCHKTGRIRSLLCAGCNTLMGAMELIRHDIPRLLAYCDAAVFGEAAVGGPTTPGA